MGIDLSGFKVVYGEKVFNALSLQDVVYDTDCRWREKTTTAKLRFIEILAINEDGHIIVLHDEAWCFQFIPIVSGK